MQENTTVQQTPATPVAKAPRKPRVQKPFDQLTPAQQEARTIKENAKKQVAALRGKEQSELKAKSVQREYDQKIASEKLVLMNNGIKGIEKIVVQWRAMKVAERQAVDIKQKIKDALESIAGVVDSRVKELQAQRDAELAKIQEVQ